MGVIEFETESDDGTTMPPMCVHLWTVANATLDPFADDYEYVVFSVCQKCLEGRVTKYDENGKRR